MVKPEAIHKPAAAVQEAEKSVQRMATRPGNVRRRACEAVAVGKDAAFSGPVKSCYGRQCYFIITSGYVVGYTVFRAMKNKSGEAGHGACTLALSVYNQFMECKLSKNDLTVPGIVGANCKREI